MSNQGAEKEALGLAAGGWKEAFRNTNVEKERLEHAKGDRGRATSIGNFLGRNINREVSIEVNGRTGKATLRQKQGRSGTKLYYFDIVWDEEQPTSAGQSVENPTADDEPQPVSCSPSIATDSVPTSTPENFHDSHAGRGPILAANDEAW